MKNVISPGFIQNAIDSSHKMVVLSLLLLTFLLSSCEDNKNISDQTSKMVARPAKIVTLKQNTAILQRTYPGTLEASQKADIAFRVSGQLLKLKAIPGLRVKTGEVLAELDPTDYKNIVTEKQARFNLATTQLAQVRRLLKQKMSSQLEYDKANAEFKSAQAALQHAKDNLRYTFLKAPFDALVARVSIENFQPVQAQTKIIQLRSEDDLAIRFSVPESLLAQLKQIDDPDVINNFCGQVSFVSHPNKKFRACHKEHESIADPLTRNYSALFELEKINSFVVLPGMTATITLDFSKYLANEVKQIVYASIEAVFSEQDKKWLWQVDDKMIAHKLPVEVGRIEGNMIEITNNIDPNTQIIAAGVSYVREGMLIKPIVKQRGL